MYVVRFEAKHTGKIKYIKEIKGRDGDCSCESDATKYTYESATRKVDAYNYLFEAGGYWVCEAVYIVDMSEQMKELCTL